MPVSVCHAKSHKKSNSLCFVSHADFLSTYKYINVYITVCWSVHAWGSVCVHVRDTLEPYISSEQFVGHSKRWPALNVARMSLFAVS